MTCRALITGVAGQDGHYLSELLLSKGYEVFGLVRFLSAGKYDIPDGVSVLYGDMSDQSSLASAVKRVNPDEVYNLAAISHVEAANATPGHTFQVNTIGVFYLLELAREYGFRLYQAGTAEMYGEAEGAINEDTPLAPMNPYAVSKTAAHLNCQHYRRQHGVWVCEGIAFNHESPLRGERFFPQKVATAAARAMMGLGNDLVCGNLDTSRDWGFAGDFVIAMHAMMQLDKPDDFILATGEAHTALELIQSAERAAGVKLNVIQDERFMRKGDVSHRVGDAGKAERAFGWKASTPFDVMVSRMVYAAVDRIAPTFPMSAGYGYPLAQYRTWTLADSGGPNDHPALTPIAGAKK
jgi:GDPmannose 4,6-dehydratase